MNWQAFRLYALWCWHQLLTLGLAALVVVAVMVGVSRELLPLADQYRPRLEQALSQRLGVPVTLARVEGEADGIQLFLRLSRLELHDPAAPGTVLLGVPEVELRPQVWQSLWHRELRVDVRLHGLDIHFDQQPDGRLQLRELAGLAHRDAATAARTLGFVLRQPVLALSESRIGVTFTQLPELQLRNVELVNRNSGDGHRLAARLRLPGTAEELQLQAEFDGDPLHWQQGRLRAWVHLPVLDLDGWLPVVANAGSRYGLTLQRLRGGGQYWLEVDRGRLASVQAEVDWREVSLLRDGQPRQLEHLRGQLAWRRNGGGWLLAGDHLRGRVDGQPWPLPAVALRGGPQTLSVAARNTHVAGALRLLSGVTLPPALADWLREAQPVGQVSGLRADLGQRPEGGWRLRRLDVQGAGFGAAAVALRPGVRNLGGWLRWTPDRAWAGIALRQGELLLPNFLHEPVPVFHLEGRLRLAREGEGWRLDSDRVQGANADLGAEAVFSVAVPADASQPRLALVGSLRQARAASAWRYVPWHAGSERVIEWLRQNITAGAVPQGAIAYHGPLHPDPELDPGHLQLSLRLQHASVDYAPGWPGLRELDADVLLDGSRLAVSNGTARLLDGTHGRQLEAAIADLHAPELTVAGNLDTTGADLNRLFRDSPLASHLPGLTDALALEGPLSGQLALSLPLHAEAQPDVTVVAQLRDNRLFLKPARLTASRVSGEIRYATQEGLSSPGLDAELLEAPIRADIRSEGGAHPTVIVNVAGTAGVPALRRWLGAPLLDMTSGSTPYQVRVTVPAGAPARLQLDTALTGLRVNLPAPLGKGPADAVPLRYQVGLGSGEQFGRLQYGQRLTGGLVWVGSRLDRALLRLDSGAPGWPQQSGLEIEGRLPRLDVAEWRPLLERLQRRERGQTVAARGESAMPDLTRLDLDVQSLLVENWRLRNARVGLARQPGAWLLGLSSDELDGRARLPDAAGSEIRIGFSRLQWPLPQATPRAGTAAAGPGSLAGLGNRPLAVEGDGLRLAAWPGLGILAVKARVQPLPAGVRVDDLLVRGAQGDFAGQLDWQWRGGASTRLQGRAGSSNVTGLLAAFGVTPPLVSRHATADLDLSWPGGPDAATFANLDGHVLLALEQGRLLNVSTGTSASRVFGWFSLDNLQRRLKGDFADVTRRGLAFDSISLEGDLEAGVMPSAVVQMKGPTLQAQGQGRLDLGQKKVDQQFTVLMPVTSAVPIAAVALAGPVVGGAVAAAKMAFDKQIDRATELHYRVSGDWGNPAIERLTSRTPPPPVPRKPAPGVNIATKEAR